MAEKEEFEYEMLFKSDPYNTIQLNGWYPIATNRIKHPEKIEEYIKQGVLRKITKPKDN